MTKTDSNLFERIQTKKVKIGIIGLGYVGLPLAILFAKKGFAVTGFARNAEKAALFMDGKHHLSDKAIDQDLQNVLAKKRFKAVYIHPDDLQMQDVIIICVPTPVDENKKPDLSDLRAVGKILKNMHLSGKLIVNESTVAPFTTRDILGNFKGTYYLVASPERIDPGNKTKTTEKIPKVIGGASAESLRLGMALYEQILQEEIITVNSLEAAEMAKMLENTYRAVNIALVNEFAKLAEACNIDILEVIKAAKTKWSFQAHYPGIGVGGHCIPVDPYYILELAKARHISMDLVEKGLSEIEEMPEFVLQKLLRVYKKGMRILVYGITYKKDVKDIRESPVIAFCQLLKKHDIPFTVYDPLLSPSAISSLGLTPGAVETVDIFVVGTDHAALQKDYKKVISENTYVIDGRNFFTSKKGRAVYGVGRTL